MKTYFFDFDGVIFDLKRFNADFRIILIDFGFSAEFIHYYYSRENPRITPKLSKTFHLFRNIEKYGQELDFDACTMRHNLNDLISGAKDYLFFDAKQYLNCLAKEQLVLLSSGCSIWQSIKMTNSGILDIFGNTALSDGIKKSEALTAYLKYNSVDTSKSFFIDDTPSKIVDIKKIFPEITCILLDRESEYAKSENECADHIITNLREAQEITETVLA